MANPELVQYHVHAVFAWARHKGLQAWLAVGWLEVEDVVADCESTEEAIRAMEAHVQG